MVSRTRNRFSPTRRSEPRAIRGRTRFALVTLILVGETISAYLTYAHHRIHGDLAWVSACNLGRVVNCDLALTSAYAVAGGIPLSLWGVWFYGLLFLASVPSFFRQPNLAAQFPALALFAATAVGVGISIALAALSAFVLRSVCVLCLTLYLVNVLLMFVARKAASESGQAAVAGWSVAWRNKFLQFLVAIGLLLIPSMRTLYAHYSPGGSDICQTLAVTQRESFGQPISIEVYSDFQCPHCRNLDKQLQALAGRARVRIAQEHYPLETNCNPDVTTTRHPGACLQARAAICSDVFGIGPELRQRLFTEAPSSMSRIVELASTLGVDGRTFEACVMADGIFEHLKSSIARARSFGVTATPTLIINGRKHAGALSTTGLECLIAASAPP